MGSPVTLAELEDEVENLRYLIEQLAPLADADDGLTKTERRLTKTERRLIGFLTPGVTRPHEAIYAALYRHRMIDDWPDNPKNNVRVYITRLRRRGYKIMSVHGTGYRLEN
jgi:DNA-binding response OmpR family regulator